MASRLFALVSLALIVAGISAFLVAAGWIPWTYPAALFAIVLLGWGFAAVRGMRRPAQPITARGGRPGPELWDSAGRALEEDAGRG